MKFSPYHLPEETSQSFYEKWAGKLPATSALCEKHSRGDVQLRDHGIYRISIAEPHGAVVHELTIAEAHSVADAIIRMCNRTSTDPTEG